MIYILSTGWSHIEKLASALNEQGTYPDNCNSQIPFSIRNLGHILKNHISTSIDIDVKLQTDEMSK